MIATIEERIARLEHLAGVSRKEGRQAAAGRTRRAIETVQRHVADEFGLTVESLLENSRRREVVWPRQVAMHICYRLDLAGSKVIGLLFGDREHATVLYAHRSVQGRVDTERGAALMVGRLIEEIKTKIEHEQSK